MNDVDRTRLAWLSARRRASRYRVARDVIAEIGSQERADLEAEVRELRAALSQIADFVGAPRSEGERRPEAIVKRAKELITGISRAAMPQWMHVNDDPNVPRSTTWPTS